jgi:hypothetical protein
MTEPDPRLVFGGIPLTEWIQAIGALIAILAGVYGFYRLFRKDKDKQDQLESLKGLAKQSILQTGHLFSHTLHMEESNKLLREQVSVFKERLNIEKVGQEQREKEAEVERRIRKNDLLPIFNQIDGHGANELLKIKFLNKGGQAKIIGAEIIGADHLSVDKRLLGKTVAKGEEVLINVHSANPSLNANNATYALDLIFDNTDGDRLKARFICNGIACKQE